jgi:acyl carrier protein
MSETELEIFSFVKERILSFLDIEESTIVPTAQIAELGLESLDFIEIQVELEKAYGVKVPPSVFANGEVKTMGQFASYVSARRQARAA